MNSVQRVVVLMETLLSSEEDLGIREIAARADLPRSTVQRILCALEQNGWVSQDSRSQSYRVALRFLAFADGWRLRLELTRRACPIMDELCARSCQTVLLLVQDGACGICLHKVEPEQTIKLVAEVGKSFPLHAAACGKILLAFAPPTLQNEILSRPLKAYTSATITDSCVLKKEIETICANGYAVSFEEMTPGAAEIAVPLVDSQGSFVAALSVAGPRFNMEGRMAEFEALLRSASRRILENVDSEKGAEPCC
ncbi:MAG: IclR family transcriptional regulator [Fretibacterium sp.]|nr:IclR family transcriptional regulator [Fretibacterium sp.]